MIEFDSPWLAVSQGEIASLLNKYCNNCPDCKGTRKKIIDTDTYRKVELCGCVERYLDEYKLVCAGIPEMLRVLSKDDIDKDFLKQNHDNWRKVAVYSKKLKDATESGAGLYIYGENGAGKSFAASLILKRALREGYTGYFIVLRKLVDIAIAAFGSEAARADIEKLVTEIDFLVIDELDKFYQDRKDLAMNLLEDLFKKRYYSKKPLIVTSNVDSDQIKHILGPTVAATFSERLFNITLVGNYRPAILQKLHDEFFDQ